MRSYQRYSLLHTDLLSSFAVGLLLLCPLGDLLRPRPLLLTLTTVSALLSLSLALTPQFTPFLALCFLSGVSSITPQVLLPLAADLSPPHRRSMAIATCISGILLGVLLARVLAGALADNAPWRTAYFFAAGLQGATVLALYALLPDYPPRAPTLSYLGVLKSMGKYVLTEPVLVQAGLINFAGVACFANFWVTLTFLLGGAPYHYSTFVLFLSSVLHRCTDLLSLGRLQIGLVGLLGLAGVLAGPPIGHLIDRIVPWHAALVGTLGFAASQAVHTAAGGYSIAAVAVACVGLDVFRQAQQVAVTAAAVGLEGEARSRLNAVVILCAFLGQVMGTVGSFVIFTWDRMLISVHQVQRSVHMCL